MSQDIEKIKTLLKTALSRGDKTALADAAMLINNLDDPQARSKYSEELAETTNKVEAAITKNSDHSTKANNELDDEIKRQQYVTRAYQELGKEIDEIEQSNGKITLSDKGLQHLKNLAKDDKATEEREQEIKRRKSIHQEYQDNGVKPHHIEHYEGNKKTLGHLENIHKAVDLINNSGPHISDEQLKNSITQVLLSSSAKEAIITQQINDSPVPKQAGIDDKTPVQHLKKHTLSKEISAPNIAEIKEEVKSQPGNSPTETPEQEPAISASPKIRKRQVSKKITDPPSPTPISPEAAASVLSQQGQEEVKQNTQIPQSDVNKSSSNSVKQDNPLGSLEFKGDAPGIDAPKTPPPSAPTPPSPPQKGR